ncbi:NAD(P)H-binding protein [Planotetraspora sp. A-T 1434]|uniref:NAD(P)-dependent oxidoreductase n=1 Tax=Planotetraspora sp. A-T 1434 TaxID=2979219 RepID=UPI0021C1B098|nr:NAD(P)H-binding protein [Planotetraspora sp. A-T 1434]MCT9930916.1 NAD(P)H-binding protein [Planotetraspora sp. A-T 1434]
MKVLLIGATGMIGSRIAAELASRGHEVTPASRATGLDASDASSVARATEGHDAVISAVAPPRDGSDPEGPLLAVTRALIEGVRQGGVRRLIALGGAGGLEVAPGTRLVDTPDFPEIYKKESLAQAEALEVYRGTQDLDWTYVAPAAEIAPGERTGSFQVGGDRLLTDDEGRSFVSAEDCAVLVVDELEKGGHIRQRVTLAY